VAVEPPTARIVGGARQRAHAAEALIAGATVAPLLAALQAEAAPGHRAAGLPFAGTGRVAAIDGAIAAGERVLQAEQAAGAVAVAFARRAHVAGAAATD